MSEEKVLTLRGKKAVWVPGGGTGPIDPKRLPEGYPYKDGVTIEWDGNTEGLESVGGVLYLVSPEILTDEQIRAGVMTDESGTEMAVGDVITWDALVSAGYITEDIVMLESVVFVRKDGAVFSGFEFNTAGVYFMSRNGKHIQKFVSETIHPMAPEFLPGGYPYKAIEKTALVENMSVTPGYHEPAAYEANFAFAEGQTYAVEWNGETYECVAFSMEGIAAIGNLALLGAGDDTGEPFIMYAYNGSLYIKGTDSSAAVTLSIYGQAETIQPMAEEFMPLLTSPNGTKYKLTVSDDGTLSAVKV